MAALHKALHIENVVIVTPSVYGTDNRATLEGIEFRGNTARGVAVIDDKTPESDLDMMGRPASRASALILPPAASTIPASAASASRRRSSG